MSAVVIIGTGLAGYNLAREFRKLDAERELILISRDDGRSYSKPMLSTGFTKGKDADGLAMASAEQMAGQLKATVRSHVQVEAIDTAAQTVVLAGGERIAYGALVLALGADPFRPAMGGDAADQVYSVNDLMDYGRFRRALQPGQKVIVIGGGLIGSEFANDLSNGGHPVELVEPMGRVLPGLLPPRASEAVAAGLASLGVVFHFGPSVTAVDRDGDQLCVTLSSGQHLTGDVVLSAIGLRPRIALAQSTGLTVNRGIVTDRTLRTSDPHIYAFGDCAEVDGLILPYVLPLMASARALAKTLAGRPTPVHYPCMPVTIKTPVCPVVTVPVAPKLAGEWTIEAEGNDVKALFHGPDGQLLGWALTGRFAQDTALKAELGKATPALLG